uniref:Uncharacterized protein n=1 Tax=Anopheles culicifacies TaxID=139723 RepID=A0A182MP59_9DIPT
MVRTLHVKAYVQHHSNVVAEDCEPQDFVCNDGTCLDAAKQCDDVPDCRDGEDEHECDAVPECDETSEFMCRSDNTCIPKSSVCDRQPDCTDGEDEENCEACPRDTWQCDYGQCIPHEQKCDGNIDCPDDISDERNCPRCSPYEFQCRWDKACIPLAKKCDRVYDCYDKTDEQVCAWSHLSPFFKQNDNSKHLAICKK